MHEFKPGSFGALPILRLSSDGIEANNCGLTALDGCPEVVTGYFDIMYNQSLTSLVGGPKEVGGNYSAKHCGLTTLKGIPVKIGGWFDLSSNPLTSLQGINNLKEMKGWANLTNCPITSHILGVFFIKGCWGILSNYRGDISNTVTIVNSHISKGRAGLLPCQKELIEAGLADFAQI
jgi:hypothetical protein